MKKFSKISNSPVGKITTDVDSSLDKKNESDFFKSKIIGLMNSFLTVQMYGPITRYHTAGTMKVAGKELFLEALMEEIKNFSIKSNKKILEEIQIDNNIESIGQTIKDMEIYLESNNTSRITKSKEKIKSFYKRYKDDKDLMMVVLDRNISRIKNGETAYWRAIAAEDLSSEGGYSRSILKEISNKYRFKSTQLGFKKSI